MYIQWVTDSQVSGQCLCTICIS